MNYPDELDEQHAARNAEREVFEADPVFQAAMRAIDHNNYHGTAFSICAAITEAIQAARDGER